jgi:site-specific DNA-methyltransferase (adenine-specific)
MFKNLVGAHKPDILDCISNLSSDEVFTPPSVVNQILNRLPNEVWSNPNYKWLDPATKSGVFLREIAIRLLEGLADIIPDETARREHIFKNMLFGLAITELTGLIARRSVYYSKDASSEYSVFPFDSMQGNIIYQRGRHHYVNGKCWHCGAPQGELDRGEHLENYAYSFIHDNTKIHQEPYALNKFGADMKFDVIIGNPPYQLQDAGESTGASPIYNLFIEQAKKLNPRYISMIIPSRWFAGGKGLDTFREDMLNDKRISHLVDYHDASDCFPGVSVEGGVCYFLWDNKHNGKCTVTTIVENEVLDELKRDLNEYDVFVRFNKAISILNKTNSKTTKFMSSMTSSRKPFGFSTNFKDFKDKEFSGSTKLYGKSVVGYVDNSKITINRQWIDKYKVIISAAYGTGSAWPRQVLGKPIITEKNTCCTETYMVIGSFDTLNEAKNLELYIKSKFFRFMVSLKKISQHNPKDRFDFVPLISFSEPTSDQELYKMFDLTNDEIAFIESMIKEMP